MTEAIRGKIARVLNSREVALNIGSANGVSVGMYFDVMDPTGEDITDPDTEEVLGSIERSRVRVKVTHVQERLSIASTYKTKRINVGGHGIDPKFTRFLMPPEWITKYETLKTKEKTWEDIDEEESYVRAGDPVIQVIENKKKIEETAETTAP